MAVPINVRIYTRKHCHLCEEAKAAVERVSDETGVPVRIEEVDVDEDDALRAEYGERVPYVFVDGWPSFKYVVDEEELKAQLLNAR